MRKCWCNEQRLIAGQILQWVNVRFFYLFVVFQGAHFSRDTVNRPGFAKMFFESASEEREHAIKIISYLLMRGELTSEVRKLIQNPVCNLIHTLIVSFPQATTGLVPISHRGVLLSTLVHSNLWIFTQFAECTGTDCILPCQKNDMHSVGPSHSTFIGWGRVEAYGMQMLQWISLN
jgi:hypothetical protein